MFLPGLILVCLPAAELDSTNETLDTIVHSGVRESCLSHFEARANTLIRVIPSLVEGLQSACLEDVVGRGCRVLDVG